MKFIKTDLDGVFEVAFDKFEDERGSFIKTFHYNDFEEIGLKDDFKESFYSISKKNVIRGLHFHIPPYAHDKLVYPMFGEVKDVILDLRKGSETYGKYISLILSKEKNNGVFIPKGFAHGFLTLSDDATLIYMDTTVFHKESDSGIRRDSIGFDRGVSDPIISEKDKNLIELKKFISPF